MSDMQKPAQQKFGYQASLPSLIAPQAFDDEGLQPTTSQLLSGENMGAPLLYRADAVDREFAYVSVAARGGAGQEPVNQVVEPGSVFLALLGLAGLIAFRRSRFHPDNHIP